MEATAKKSVLKWELCGIAFVFFIGALLHFLFEWSSEARVVGAFASVNESVWEHFKQGFWPMCLFAAIEYSFPKMRITNLIFAKALAVYVIPIVTGLLFYAYTAIVGEEILLVDIFIFLVAIIIGQTISYKLITASPFPMFINIVGGVFLMLLALVLILTTFYPPHWPIFLDSNTGTYGIPIK
jgi:hypothetical protein